jgi:hypothetical protein
MAKSGSMKKCDGASASVVLIFPNRESAIRLLGALLMEQDEQWSTGKRYFDMIAYWQWRANSHEPQEGSGGPSA